jgi:aryl-alcohol dehydrogenase-like predicted oxidoreductase
MKSVPLPIAGFGSRVAPVTRLGMGGEGILRTFGRDAEARAAIEAALEEGVTYFESARAYLGSEAYLGRALGARRERVFLASKAHDRTRSGARAMLEQSLRALRTDCLDLWQFHDIREPAEVDALDEPAGAYAAFVEAKERGDVRAIGVTGHYAPAVLRAAVERVPFDAVLLPINPAEGSLSDGFERSVVPAARARGMAVVGMKVFARGGLLAPTGGLNAPEAMHYALAADVDVLVVGCDDADQVRANAAAARSYEGMSAERRGLLERRVADGAEDLAYYRRSASSDA